MTTLELAEDIALEVMKSMAGHAHAWDDARDHAVAVLRTLHKHQSWFCRLTITEDAQGNHVDTIEAPYEMVQQELFHSR